MWLLLLERFLGGRKGDPSWCSSGGVRQRGLDGIHPEGTYNFVPRGRAFPAREKKPKETISKIVLNRSALEND